VIAYAADAVVGAAPLLPGGIGLVEGALVVALVGGGIPFAAATAAVVIYRGISFVPVVVVGWTLWLWTRHGQRHAQAAPVDRTPRRSGRATPHRAPATAPLAATTGQDG
jgi:putative heme transporter